MSERNGVPPTNEEVDKARLALAEDVALAGKAIMEIKASLDDLPTYRLMLPWQKKRFLSCLGKAAAECMRAMDVLMPDVSPTTAHMLKEMIQRYKDSPQERELIISVLRKAFTEKKP